MIEDGNKYEIKNISIQDCYPSSMLDEKVEKLSQNTPNIAKKQENFDKNGDFSKNINNINNQNTSETSQNINPLLSLLGNLNGNQMMQGLNGNLLSTLMSNGGDNLPIMAIIKNMLNNQKLKTQNIKESENEVENCKRISDYQKIE